MELYVHTVLIVDAIAIDARIQNVNESLHSI